MKRKKSNFAVVIVSIVLITALFAGCTNPADESDTTYKVTFNLNGGSGTTPSAQTVSSGSSITLPVGSGLSKTGSTFGGWNTKSDGTGTNYNASSSYTPTGNVTLYARWNTGSQSTEYWTIIWYLDGGAFASGSSHPTQIAKGTVLAKPSPDPAKANNTFGGQQTAKYCTTSYFFSWVSFCNGSDCCCFRQAYA